jgi:nitroreductase
MELFETIGRRASTHNLQPAAIDNAVLELILDAGRRAASMANVQPFELIVVQDRNTIAQLARAQECIGEVGVVIAIVADPTMSAHWPEDVAAATENMLLAITALKYASVWIGATLLADEDEHKAVLGVPEHLRLAVLLPIGEAAEPTEQAPKRALSEMVHWERYGQTRD